MRRMALPLVVACLSLSFAPAPLPRPRQRPDPLAGIEGVWRSEKNLARITRTRLSYLNASRHEYDVTWRPNAVPPAYSLRGLGKAKGTNFEGLYRLEGDELILADNPANRGRPAHLRAAEEVEVYRRVRE
jgi:hypothetical protein